MAPDLDILAAYELPSLSYGVLVGPCYDVRGMMDTIAFVDEVGAIKRLRILRVDMLAYHRALPSPSRR